MRLSGPTLRDELLRARYRSLRMFLLPAVLALALYAFYVVGGYRQPVVAPTTPKHGRIYGTVVDKFEKGKPLSGITVTISYSSSREPMPVSAPATDINGHFLLDDLPAGSYELQATADGYDMQTQSTNVEPGKTTEIDLVIYQKSERIPKPHHSPSPKR